MNTEEQIIKRILHNFTKSENHENEFFSSDAEVIKIGNKRLLVTIDSFSDEDNFRTDNSFILGHNLAACTFSDIFACGGKPLFFCNSLSSSKSWDENYINYLSQGIADVIKKCGCSFIGGDFGYSESWNYSGVSIGESENPVSRKGANAGDLIFLTGEIGSGNFEAATQLRKYSERLDSLFKAYRVTFPIRNVGASLVSQYASSCIDTSDGLINSLRIISKLNNIGFEIQNIPFFKPGSILTDILSLPNELLAFGECGEYELLFTINPKNEESLLNDAQKNDLKLHKIGIITKEQSMILISAEKRISLNDYCLSARDYNDHQKYIMEMTKYLKSKLGDL